MLVDGRLVAGTETGLVGVSPADSSVAWTVDFGAEVTAPLAVAAGLVWAFDGAEAHHAVDPATGAERFSTDLLDRPATPLFGVGDLLLHSTLTNLTAYRIVPA